METAKTKKIGSIFSLFIEQKHDMYWTLLYCLGSVNRGQSLRPKWNANTFDQGSYSALYGGGGGGWVPFGTQTDTRLNHSTSSSIMLPIPIKTGYSICQTDKSFRKEKKHLGIKNKNSIMQEAINKHVLNHKKKKSFKLLKYIGFQSCSFSTMSFLLVNKCLLD